MKIRLFALLLALDWIYPLVALEIGDPAPPLQVAEWVQGDKVELGGANSKKIYVVEFWTTWCPPCRVSIPHLTGLHHKLNGRGVTFIGVSNEEGATVKSFVEKMGPKMGYTVAVDQDNQTTQAYLGAFGIGGIPHAFVIDKKGRVVWHGHPMGSLSDVLALVLADQFDPDVVPTADTAVQHAREYLSQARQGKSKAELAKLGPGVLREADKNFDLLNHFAWTILTDPRIQTRDTFLALQAAKLASDATEGAVPAVLDTYARALSESGDMEEAVETQKKAIELADHKPLKEKLESTLRRYQEQTKAPASEK